MFFRLLGFFIIAFVCAAAPANSLRGKLVQQAGQDPAVQVSGHNVPIQADEDTMKVLEDERLSGADVELIGHAAPDGRFIVNPTETHPVFVWRDGKRLYVTYWCDVCYIRTFVPGNCWCCQKYTDLDLRESLDE